MARKLAWLQWTYIPAYVIPWYRLRKGVPQDMRDSASMKHRAITQALAETIVGIYVNPQIRGVRLPERLYLEPTVVLDLGYNLPVPIPDLRLTEDGFTATLSFARVPYMCVIPWAAVFALVPRNNPAGGLLWPASLPAIQRTAENNTFVRQPVLESVAGRQVPRFALAGPGAASSRAPVVNLLAYKRARSQFSRGEKPA